MGSARPRRASRRWMCAVGMRVRVDPIIAHNNGLCPTPPGLLAVDVRSKGGVWSRARNYARQRALPNPAGPPGGGRARSGCGSESTQLLRTTTGSAQPRRASWRWTCAVRVGFGVEPGTTHDNGLCPTPPGLLAVDVRGRDAGPSRPRYCARQRALPNPAGPPGGGSAQ
ncbi:hypothetical protein RhiJN_06930 [Ceratobasidium sp. AG-Ba]|nr:hypothetical protein RhiJN_06930 [Ceratobasidium sp. AG-Ba]